MKIMQTGFLVKSFNMFVSRLRFYKHLIDFDWFVSIKRSKTKRSWWVCLRVQKRRGCYVKLFNLRYHLPVLWKQSREGAHVNNSRGYVLIRDKTSVWVCVTNEWHTVFILLLEHFVLLSTNYLRNVEYRSSVIFQ